MNKINNYFVGIDAGSDSIGWAATDENYNLLRLKGKTAWGARIFNEASDAKARRIFRTSGRRMERRKHRLDLLQSLFETEINKVDDTFFLRLSESNYCIEDRNEKIRLDCPLFKNIDQEKAYYKKYPTIWHLRKALLENDSNIVWDIRLVYLAIHHILKYRGNFLKSGSIDPKKFNYSIFNEINSIFKTIIAEEEGLEVDDIDFQLISEKNYQEVIKILLNKDLYKTKQKTEIKALLTSADKDSIVSKYIELFVTLIVGGSFDSSKIFPDNEKINIEFNGSFDDKVGVLQQMFEDNYALIEYLKSIFDFVYVSKILGSENSLSCAYVRTYQDHKKQLIELKEVIKEIDIARGLKGHDRVYYDMFHNPKEQANYCALVNVDSDCKKRIPIDEFDKYVKKILLANESYVKNKKAYKELLKLAENNELLQYIAIVSNSTIPYQLHYNELVTILDNSAKHFDIIKANKDKIISLFLFRVPYYYGPLDSRSPYSNIVLNKEAKGSFTPWNIDQYINDDETRKKFMNSLTNKCTYLFAENVLPKESIIYSDFVILNRLNTMRINESVIDNDLKLKLFKYISSRSKTTIKQIKVYLASIYEGILNQNEISISGVGEDSFISNARSILGRCFDLDKSDAKVMAENIIFLLTVYTDNKDDAIKVINKQYSLNAYQLTCIKSLNCKGWSPLSKKLLIGLRPTNEEGEPVDGNIYSLLMETNENFMQILNNEKYSFSQIIDNENEKAIGSLSKQQIIDEYIENTPPLMHRTIIQILRIINEIKSVVKKEPQKIAIEVTRTNKAKKEVSISRKSGMDKFLKSFKKDFEYYEQSCTLKSQLDELVKNKELFKLKGKHLFLYFKQLGLDMYTGEKININDVLNGTDYDIDHIIPQSLIKNDSFDNTVLTKRKINQEIKKDQYPLPEKIRNNETVKALWKFLFSHKQISDIKYNALIRANPITESELADFVNRQINVVDSSNKVVKDILEKIYPKTKVIFSKAEYPSYIRKEYNIPKIRDLNDTHHAVDAYLNIVAGTILYDTYGNIRIIKARIEKENSADTNFNKDSFNMEHTIDRNLKNNGLLGIVQRICNKHDFLLTYRNSYQDNAFYDMTINAKGESNALIPIHGGEKSVFKNTSKYGGYISVRPEYMIVANRTNKNGKSTRVLVTVPRMVSILSKNDDEIKEKLLNRMGLSNNEITFDFKRRIYPNQKVLIAGCEYLLCTKNELQIILKPVTPIYIEQKDYLSLILKNITKLKNHAGNECEFYTDRFEKNKQIISKDKNLALFKEIVNISLNKKYDYCPMVSNIRNGLNDENLIKFQNLSLENQVKTINDVIVLYGRKSTTTAFISVSNFFSKSKAVFLKDNVIIIDESVTGLYRRETII